MINLRLMIDESIEKIRACIAEACARRGRDPAGVTVVAISKGKAVGAIQEVFKSGIADVGENRVGEALVKQRELSVINPSLSARWHLVGHLQTNKVKDAVSLFDLIQSVDSVRLAAEIDKQAAKINKLQGILIEVKTSPELSKFGLPVDQAAAAIETMRTLKNVCIRGLMTIAPLVDEPEKARPYFRQLKQLFDGINRSSFFTSGLAVLSMGMTNDYQVAVEEGATMVRLGRAIFGE